MANPDGPERRRWQLKKEVSVGDLIAFAMAAGAVIVAWNNLNTRLAVVEDHQTQQSATDKRQDDDSLRYQARIDSALVEINRKLDRIIERR